MAEYKDLLKKLKKNPELKYKRKPEFAEKADAWLDENVNQPLARKGYENLGAGLSAAGSTLAGLLDSDENVIAMTAPGVGKGLRFKDLPLPERQAARVKAKDKAGEDKAVKDSKTRETHERLPKEGYSSKEKADIFREKSVEDAGTVNYGGGAWGNISVKKPKKKR